MEMSVGLKYLNNYGLIARKFGIYIHVPLKINSDYFGDPMTFQVKLFEISCEIHVLPKLICKFNGLLLLAGSTLKHFRNFI